MMLFLSLNKLYVSSVSFKLNRPVGKHEVPNLVESEILETLSFFFNEAQDFRAQKS
jgi:hypothetical protein